MCRMHRTPTTVAALGIAAFLGASALHAQEFPSELSFFLEEEFVSLHWPGDPDWALQRSSVLQPDGWETLLGTRGADSYNEQRQDETVFYRLVRLPEPGNMGTSIADLEWRVTEMNINQIQRAVDAVSSQEDAIGETPPDDGDAEHSFDLFGKLGRYAWATQPGLIRVYSPRSSGFEKAFKLYSSKDSVASSPDDLQSDIDRTREWKDSPN
ncbi:MAG: hypothetical protein ACI8T1_000797 [Verrucomicrobiales bacterium]|jgi:hypothetical protein